MPRRDGTTIPRAARVTINREFVSVDQFIHEYVTNVSTTGAFIRSKDPLPVGTQVNLKFSIVLEDLETIEGVGEVVRVQEEPRGMGVVFVKLTPSSKKLLDRLLRGTDAEGARVHAGDEKKGDG